MPGIVMPPWKYNPWWKKAYKLRKEKHLEWAKKFGCYEEVKKYYELKEHIMRHVTF